ncbi:MAG: DNA methyltransferase [Terriglobales bacterium]
MPAKKKLNFLFCGDNLEILRKDISSESVDLIYLDPPFKSDKNYNLLFRQKDGALSTSQILAFEDTWEWNQEAELNFLEISRVGGKVSELMGLFHALLGKSDMLAYLAMMAPRLVELHRVLKPTGSIYLHCDPTASHYLKILLDAIFNPDNFRNEIIWKRTRAHNDTKLSRFGAVHDIVFFYSKSKERRFNRIFTERDASAPKTHDLYRHTDGKIYRKDNCRAPGGRGPRYEWNGFTHNWRFTPEEKSRLEAEGRIVYSKTGMPRVLRPVDLKKGSSLQDVWVDIDAPNSGSAETLGYPTQKPLSLLARILKSSSNEDDIVLDPFCGCGTAIEAALHLKRRWIGIDVTYEAMRVIREERFPKLGPEIHNSYEMIYRPRDMRAAEAFAKEQPFQFQDWAIQKLGGIPSRSRSGDKGVDGRLYFYGDDAKQLKQIIVSVKGGQLKAPFIRELQGSVLREHAPMGVLITLKEPTKQMRKEADSCGFYTCDSGTYPKIQFVTIKEILSDARLRLPPLTFMDEKKQRSLAVSATQLSLPGVAG